LNCSVRMSEHDALKAWRDAEVMMVMNSVPIRCEPHSGRNARFRVLCCAGEKKLTLNCGEFNTIHKDTYQKSSSFGVFAPKHPVLDTLKTT
jgi:hypothetical protein